MRQEWMGERKLRQEAEAKIDDLQKRLRSAITAPQLLSAENESRARDIFDECHTGDGKEEYSSGGPDGEMVLVVYYTFTHEQEQKIRSVLTAQPLSPVSSSGETSAVDIVALKKELMKSPSQADDAILPRGFCRRTEWNLAVKDTIDYLTTHGYLVNKTPADIIHNETCERSVSGKPGGGE